jgi:hypothetical protein
LGTLEGGSSNLEGLSPLLFELQNYFIRIKTLSDTSAGLLPKRKQITDIERISKHALTVLDYALFALESRQINLPLSAVSAVAAAEDVAHELTQIAKSYDVKLQLETTKRLQPVYANEAALKGALHGLAHSAVTAQTNDQKRTVILSVQATQPGKQRIGVLAPGLHFTSKTVSKAHNLASHARVTAPNELYAGGLGLVVSDELTKALDTALTTIRRHKQNGVGFYVSTSNQLQLV